MKNRSKKMLVNLDPTPFAVKYRPKTLDEIIGNKSTVASVRACLDSTLRPILKLNQSKQATKSVKGRTILISGPTGCGKTTLARILRNELLGRPDFGNYYFNVARYGGVDFARDIMANYIRHLPITGEPLTMILFDEAHGLTPASQDALLNAFEEPYHHCIFILCTTHPHLLKETVLGRCHDKFQVGELKSDETYELLSIICEKENLTKPDKVLKAIINACKGRPRNALDLLDKVKNIDDERLAIELIEMEKRELEEKKLPSDLYRS